MLRILHDTHIDFIRLWKITTAAMLAFIVPGLIWIAISGFQYSVEFTSGTLVQLEFTQPPDVGDVRRMLADGGLGDLEIQTFGSPNELVIRAQTSEHVAQQESSASSLAGRITAVLDRNFPNAYRVVRTEAVGPRVGAELRRDASIAMVISFAAALLYLAWRFDWRLGLASVIANVHDIVATFAFMKFMQIEISLFVIAGILTVIGYSLSDTVVVFDRLRELRRDGTRGSVYELLNKAVNETLPRTVMTGTTVVACLLALLIFGGEVLRPFAWVLLFGILVGTFSSIYVASPLVLWIEHRWPRAVSGRPTTRTPRGKDAPVERGAPARQRA